MDSRVGNDTTTMVQVSLNLKIFSRNHLPQSIYIEPVPKTSSFRQNQDISDPLIMNNSVEQLRF